MDNFDRIYEILRQEPHQISDEDLLWYLTELYKPADIPPCRVCGAPLGISSMGGGDATKMHCTSDEADWLGNGERIMVAEKDLGPRFKHYRESEYTLTRHGDRFVMDLIRRYEDKATAVEALKVLNSDSEVPQSWKETKKEMGL